MPDMNYGPSIIDLLREKRKEDELKKQQEPNVASGLASLLSRGMYEQTPGEDFNLAKFVSPSAIASGIRGLAQPKLGTNMDIVTGLGTSSALVEAEKAAREKAIQEYSDKYIVDEEMPTTKQDVVTPSENTETPISNTKAWRIMVAETGETFDIPPTREALLDAQRKAQGYKENGKKVKVTLKKIADIYPGDKPTADTSYQKRTISGKTYYVKPKINETWQDRAYKTYGSKILGLPNVNYEGGQQ